MAAKKKLTPLEQRQRRSKLMLAGLGVVLLAVLGFELPGMLGSKSTGAAAPPTTSTGASGASTTGANLAALSVASAAQVGSLSSFTRFAAKDPFRAQIATTSTTTGPSSGSTKPPSSGVGATKSTPAKPVTFAVQPAATLPAGPLVPAVVLRLNGKLRVIPVGEGFPSANPVFKLLSVGKEAIWISLVGGSFSGGRQTLQINAGHPVTLVNTTAGIDYLIRLVRVTTAPPRAKTPPASAGAAATANSTSGGTTTTGATTTTAGP